MWGSGVDVPIPTELIVCHAFLDDAGKRPIGTPFIHAPDGSQRFSKPPIFPGSIFCSDAAGIDAYLKSRPADGIPVVKAVPRPWLMITLKPYPDARSNATQKTVVVDNSIFLITLPYDNQIYTYISITNGVDWDRLSCQLYQNKNATKTVGPPFPGNYFNLSVDPIMPQA